MALIRYLFLVLFFGGCTLAVSVDSGEDQMIRGPGPSNKSLAAWQGNVRVVSSNTAMGPIKSVLNIQFPDPGIYTVQFSLAAASQNQGGPPTITPTSSIRCLAILNWVLEGNQIQRVFDIGDGVTISGTGAGVLISVQDASATLPTLIGANGEEYLVSVSVTKGTRAQFQTPVIQAGSDSPLGAAIPIIGVSGIGPTNFADFFVPQNAGVISAKVSAWDVTVFGTVPTFVFATQFNATQTVIFYRWVPATDPSFIPLVPGTKSVRVNNGSAVDSVLVSLDWGIDG